MAGDRAIILAAYFFLYLGQARRANNILELVKGESVHT